MGKAYVALFDENKRIVMLIHWGDAWVGATKGWFNVYFYPQDSSSGYQGSGYLYSSFKKTGKLWWDPYQGEQGAVYGRIDGGSAYPIAECDNASRVIKYVVILGYRYSSYNLVGMRIHDINVVADLTRKNPIVPNPEEPAVYDGTVDGSYVEVELPSAIQAFWEEIQAVVEQIVSWWEGWWPRIHFSLTVPTPAGGTATLHMSVDLLCDLRIESCEIDTPVDDQMTEAQKQAWAVQVADAIAIESPLADVLRASAWLMYDILWVVSLLLTSPIPAPYKIMAMLGYCAAFGTWLMVMLIAISEGVLPSDFLVGLIGVWLNATIQDGLHLAELAVAIQILLRVLDDAETVKKLKEWAKPRMIWGVIGIAFYFSIIAMLWFVWIRYLEISMTSFIAT